MLLLVCVALVIYLASVGIPRFVLDKVEDEARKQGIELSIESARLGYGSGLSFILRDVSIDLLDDTQNVPRLDLGRLRVGLRVSSLLQGKVKPYLIRIRRSHFSLSSNQGDDDGLSIKDINITCTINHRNVLQIVTSTPLDVEGMMISFKADLPLGQQEQQIQQQQYVQEPRLIGSLAAEWISAQQEIIDTISSLIKEQNWKPEDKPRIDISYNAINTPRCSFDVYFPTLCHDKLCFNEVSLNGAYSNDTLLIHRLVLNSEKGELTPYQVVANQATKVTVQAAYQVLTRKLSFTLDSNMPLLSIASDLVSPEDFKLVERISFHNREYSETQLQGDLSFDEDFKVLDASFLGFLLQKNIEVDSYKIDELVISFYFQDGNFAIDKASIKIGDGFVSTQSHLNNGQGHIEINASLTLSQMMLLAESIVSDGVKIELPEHLSINQPLKLQAMAKMSSVDFQSGKVALDEFLPEIEALELSMSIPELTYDGFSFSQCELEASVAKLHAFDFTQKNLAEQIKLKLAANQVRFNVLTDDAASKTPSINAQMVEGLEMAQMNKQQSLEHLMVDLSLNQIFFKEVSPQEGRHGLVLAGVDMNASVEGLQGKYLDLEKLEIKLANLKQLDLDSPKEADLSDCELDLDAFHLVYKQEKMEHVSLETRFETLEQFTSQFNLEFNKQEGQLLHFTADKAQDGRLQIKDIKATLPSGILNVLLPLESMTAYGLSLPEQNVTLSGTSDLTLNDGELNFVKAAVNLRIPRLARRGVKVLPHADIVNEVDVQAQLNLYRSQSDDILFDVPHFSLAKGERSLSGSLTCPEPGLLKFKVNSNLMLDTLDELIDDHLTHLIIRDFDMETEGYLNVRDLDLTVDVRDGLDVQATGKIELAHINALLGTYVREDDPHGNLNQEDILSKEPCKQLPTKILHGQADVVVDVHMNPAPEGEYQKVLTKSLIAINNVSLKFDNKPWLRHKKIKSGASESLLSARSVLLDTKNNFVSIHEAKGSIYPDYAIGTFFAPLRDFLSILKLQHPVDVESHYCIFPISLNSKVDMDGTIAIRSRPSFDLNLVGLELPLERFSGFLDFRKGGVYLDKLNAIFCEGVVDGSILLTTGSKSTGYDGILVFQSCNLENLAALIDNKQSRALVNGQARFRAKDLELDSLQAYGSLEIQDGDLMKMRIFAPISDMIDNLPNLIDKQEELINSGKIIPRKLTFYETVSSKLKSGTAAVVGVFTSGLSSVTNAFGQTTSNIPGANYFLNYDLSNASADFMIQDGVFSSHNLRATGSNLAVNSSLHIDLSRMYIQANLWPEMSSVLSLMLSPITMISDGIIDIKVYGTMDDLGWKIAFSRWNESNQEAHADFKLSADRHFEAIERKNPPKE